MGRERIMNGDVWAEKAKMGGRRELGELDGRVTERKDCMGLVVG